MLNLVLKDLLIQRLNLILSFLLGVFILLSFNGAMSFIIAVVVATFSMIYHGVFIDDKNNAEKIFNSLPIKREDIVKGKYISSVVFSLANLVIITIISLINAGYFVISIRHNPMYIGYIHPVILRDIIVALGSTWILMAVYLPCYFKFGYDVAKNLTGIIFTLFILGIGPFIYFMITKPNHAAAQFLLRLFSGSSQIFSGGVFLISAIAFLVSLALSVKFYKNREF